MKKRIYFFCLLAFAGMLLFTGCPTGNEGVPTDSGTWVDIPDGWVEFTCNDPAQTGQGFVYVYDTETTDITGISAQVKRVSGSVNTGYGLVICYKNSNTFYRVSIVTQGYYQVAKCLDGTFTYLSGTAGNTWLPSDKINKGLNVSNTLKFVLDKTGAVPSLILAINDNKVFTAEVDETLTEGRAGFCAAVLSEDVKNFPDTGVKLQFKKNIINPTLSMDAIRSNIILSRDGI